jgi:hypothetical protein
LKKGDKVVALIMMIIGVGIVLATLGRLMLKDNSKANDGLGIIFAVVGLSLFVFGYALLDSHNLNKAKWMASEYLALHYLPTNIADPNDILINNETCLEWDDPEDKHYCIRWKADFEHMGTLNMAASIRADLEITEVGYTVFISMHDEQLQVGDDTCLYTMPEASSVQACMMSALVENGISFENVSYPLSECESYSEEGTCERASYTSGLFDRGASYITGWIEFTTERVLDEEVNRHKYKQYASHRDWLF